jgi:preprotein translocase subunit Sec63
MQNAYETLGLPSTASEAEIRSRYLQLVREFPPDRAPERFAEIRAAFDDLRNPVAQLEKRLFSLATRDSLEALQGDIVARLRTVQLPVAVLLSLADAP